jgi:hypothetical protein
VLDPFRSDVSLLSRIDWKLHVKEIGALVSSLGCEADMSWFYDWFLARRLLRGRSFGPEIERQATECLNVWIAGSKRVDGMLRDVEASQLLLRSFLDCVFRMEALLDEDAKARLFESTLSDTGPLFQVLVVSAGHFPAGSIDKGPLVLPKDIASLVHAFEEFYLRHRHSRAMEVPRAVGDGLGLGSRKLLTFPRAGSVVLSTRQGADLIISPAQAAVLLQFFNSPGSPPPCSLGEMAAALGLGGPAHLDFVKGEVQNLAAPSHPVLRAAGGSKTYELNAAYVDSLAQGSLMVIHTYFVTRGKEDDGDADLDRRISQALNWRIQVRGRHRG